MSTPAEQMLQLLNPDTTVLDSQIADLTNQRKLAFDEMSEPLTVAPGSALSRLLSVAIPVLAGAALGGSDGATAGALAGSHTLAARAEEDKEEAQRRLLTGKLKFETLGEQLGAAQKEKFAARDDKGKALLEAFKQDMLNARSESSNNTRIQAAQIAADSRATASDRADARFDRRMSLSEKKEEEKQAKAERESTPEFQRQKLGLPLGIDVQPGVTPDKKDARILKDTIPVAAEMLDDIADLKSAVDSIGTGEILNRSALAHVRSVRKGLLSKLNKMQKFGALNAQEFKLLSDQIPEVGDNFFALSSTYKTMLDKLESDAIATVVNKASVGGFVLTGKYARRFGEADTSTEETAPAADPKREALKASIRQKLTGAP